MPAASDEDVEFLPSATPFPSGERERIKTTGKRPPWRQGHSGKSTPQKAEETSTTHFLPRQPHRPLRKAAAGSRGMSQFDKLKYMALTGIGIVTVALLYTGIFLVYKFPSDPKPVLYCRTSEFYTPSAGAYAGDGFVVRSQEDILEFEDWLMRRRLFSYYHCESSDCKSPFFGWEQALESLGYMKAPAKNFDDIFISFQYGVEGVQCEKAFPFRSKHQMRSCIGYGFRAHSFAPDMTYLSLYALSLRMRQIVAARGPSVQRENVKGKGPIHEKYCPSPTSFVLPTYFVRSTEAIEEQLKMLDEYLSTPVVGSSDGQQVTQRWVIKSMTDDKVVSSHVSSTPAATLTGLFNRANGGDPNKVHNPATWIVQKYLEKPLLWGGRKFTIRTWAVVLSISPLQVLYHDGLINRCMETYNSTTFTRSSHFTTAQAENKEYERKPFEAFSSFEHLQHFLIQQELKPATYVDKKLRRKLKDIMMFAIYSIIDEEKLRDPAMQQRYLTYQVVCFDFLLDSDFRVYLNKMGVDCDIDSGNTRGYMPANKRRVWDALGRGTLEIAEEAFFRREKKLPLSLRSFFTSLSSFHILIDEADPRDFHSSYATTVLQTHNVTERAANRLCSTDHSSVLDL
mmetsp:Transcript_13106/g.34271  ORF Transcript_13106/g.34271 Transcript_13106/m.34271 type:complete len:624 (-) Transcript_13106:363-2234(-)